MSRMAAVVVIIITLGLDGNISARPHGDALATHDGSGSAYRPRQTRTARRTRARKRRPSAPTAPAATKRPHTPAANQPAHMAPQPEDIPPVKPPKKTPPHPDKTNPGR